MTDSPVTSNAGVAVGVVAAIPVVDGGAGQQPPPSAAQPRAVVPRRIRPVESPGSVTNNNHLAMIFAGILAYACHHVYHGDQYLIATPPLGMMCVALGALLCSIPFPRDRVPKYIFLTLVHFLAMGAIYHFVRIANDASVCGLKYPKNELHKHGFFSFHCAEDGGINATVFYMDREVKKKYFPSKNFGTEWGNSSDAEVCSYAATTFWSRGFVSTEWSTPDFTKEVLQNIQPTKGDSVRQIAHTDPRITEDGSTKLPFTVLGVSCRKMQHVILRALRMDRSAQWTRLVVAKASFLATIWLKQKKWEGLMPKKQVDGFGNFFSQMLGVPVTIVTSMIGGISCLFIHQTWDISQIFSNNQAIQMAEIAWGLLKDLRTVMMFLPFIKYGIPFLVLPAVDLVLNTFMSGLIGRLNPFEDALLAEVVSFVHSAIFIALMLGMMGNSLKRRILTVYIAFLVAMSGFTSTLQPFNVLALVVVGFNGFFREPPGNEVSGQATSANGNAPTQQLPAPPPPPPAPSARGAGRKRAQAAIPVGSGGPESTSPPKKPQGAIEAASPSAQTSSQALPPHEDTWVETLSNWCVEVGKKRQRDGEAVEDEPWWNKLGRGLQGGLQNASTFIPRLSGKKRKSGGGSNKRAKRQKVVQ